MVTLTPRPDKCQICKTEAPKIKVVKRDGTVLWLCPECLEAMPKAKEGKGV